VKLREKETANSEDYYYSEVQLKRTTLRTDQVVL